jgi:hypothetical protein
MAKSFSVRRLFALEFPLFLLVVSPVLVFLVNTLLLVSVLFRLARCFICLLSSFLFSFSLFFLFVMIVLLLNSGWLDWLWRWFCWLKFG